MRITNSMMITNMLSNLGTNLRSMSRKQDELATGKRVINASDDPIGASKIMKFKADIADMAQYSTNVRDAQAWLDASESSIAEAGSVLQRVRELAVQSANGTNTVSDTQKIKQEIEQLKKHLISGANANFAGRYLFASHYTDRPVLNDEGDYSIPITLKDTLDPSVAIYEVSVAERMKVGTHGYSYLKGEVDATAFVTATPTGYSTNGAAATKPALVGTFNLTTDYSAGGDMDITVAGKTFTVNKANLVGSALQPLTTGKVLQEFALASKTAPLPADPLDQLGTYADIFFDQGGSLVVKGKNVGVAETVQSSAYAGFAATSPNPASGTDAIAASVTSSAVINDVDAATYAGKKIMMTYDGVTKEVEIPLLPVQATVAGLVTQLQGIIDNPMTGFGPGKIVVAGAAPVIAPPTPGVPLSFTSVTAAGAVKKPELIIEPVVVKTPKLIQDMNNFIAALDTGSHDDIKALLTDFDVDINNLLAVRADIGARGSRLELIDARIAENNITFTRLLSDSQDADMSEVIMNLKNAENVYKAALSVGGRIIQPTLTDFLR